MKSDLKYADRFMIQATILAAYVDEHISDFNSSRKRKVPRAYYLPYCGQRKRVCSDFFSQTLDVGIRVIQKCLEKDIKLVLLQVHPLMVVVRTFK